MIINRVSTIENIIMGPIYKTRDGRTFTKQLLNSDYSEERIRTGIYNGILIPINKDSIKSISKLKLWNSLVASNLYSESYEKFQNKYRSIDSINFLYNGLAEYNLYTKSRSEFVKEYFPDVR
ncbi:MAG: hypothetical protein ABIU11_03460 [Chitinophagaceae bacterium]